MLDPAKLALVKELIASAKENGYTFDQWTDGEVADDMLAYAEEVQDWTLEELVPYVHEARK